MAERIELLLIDPQHDFCDPSGALFVKGADEDMRRVASLVKRSPTLFFDINLTMDCHHDVHVAHPIFWINARGQNPAPFTIIGVEQVLNEEWRPAIPSKALRSKTVDYVKALAQHGRYPFVILPPHCIIGSIGNNIVPAVHEAIRDWERREFATVAFVTKGANPFVEFFSAIQAAVPDPNDPTTALNTSFLEKLLQADSVLVAGAPGSHMVANTMRDIADAVSRGNLKKFVLLTDAISPATGFEKAMEDFLREMSSRGVALAKTTDF